MTCSCSPWPDMPALSTQPIYPFEIDPVPHRAAECLFRLQPMCAAVFRFRLPEGANTAIGVVHTAPITIQDRSLRVWVSDRPIGSSVVRHPSTFFTWEANRVPGQHYVLYDENSDRPDAKVPTLAVPHGFLYLNVANLVNSLNEFSLRLTRCPCNDTP